MSTTPRRSTALVALLLLAAACSKGSPGPAPDSGRCDVDLSPYRALSGTATARQITSAADLMQGDSATGRVGDFLLENDKIRVIVQAPDRHIQPNPFGGAIVDADVVRAAGEASNDQFGKFAPFIQFGRTLKAEKVEVLPGTGAAVVAATGPDEVNDYLNVKAILPAAPLVDPDVALGLRITNYYVLAPGESRVRVVTALCNPTAAALKLAYGDLLDSGGDVEFFNPRQKTGGFGYKGGIDGISDFPFYSYAGQGTAYAYVPPAATGNHQVTVSGVTGTLLGQSLFEWVRLGPTSKIPDSALHVPAGGSASYQRFLYVGRTLGDVTSQFYADRGATVRISGKVTLGGAAAPGARVAVITTETNPANFPLRHPVAVLEADAQGNYAGRVPAGTYELAADYRAQSRTPSPFPTLTLSADAVRDFDLAPLGRLQVGLADPGGQPVPGKVLVYCESGPCVARGGNVAGGADDEGNFFRASSSDPWPKDVQAWAFVDTTGKADIDLPGGGSYTIVASHGPTWSVHPSTWPADRGAPFTVAAGATVTRTITLAQVLDTTEWIGADFHVHGVNSPDAPTALLDRVRTFLADGVDLLVATDHDFVTDYGPSVAILDAQVATVPGAAKPSDLLATMVGEELTTFDYGHWNGFPIARTAGDLTGGAVDWGNALLSSLTPREIHLALRNRASTGGGALPAVVQANHPRGSLGWFTAVWLDNGSGQTHACPQRFRLPPLAGCDPAKGQDADTGLFDEGFTAMEIVNDFEEERIHGRMNDWFTFLSRGLKVTATAVSDTHQRYLSAAGWGRTWVKLGTSDPKAIDPAALVTAVAGQKAVASLGGFVDVVARVNGVAAGGIGDTVTVPSGGSLSLHVVAQAPEWLRPGQLELHAYGASRATRHDAVGGGEDDYGNRRWPGYVCSLPIAPGANCNGVSASEAADLAAAGVQVSAVVPGDRIPVGATGEFRWNVVRDFAVSPLPAQDSWFVVVLRRPAADAQKELAPGVPAGPAVTILAVTNPVFVDVDGNGRYDAPLGKVPRTVPWSPPPIVEAASWEEAVRAELARPQDRCRADR